MDGNYRKNYHLSILTAFWKESMINWLSNLINRNRSAAKILCSILCLNAPQDVQKGEPVDGLEFVKHDFS